MCPVGLDVPRVVDEIDARRSHGRTPRTRCRRGWPPVRGCSALSLPSAASGGGATQQVLHPLPGPHRLHNAGRQVLGAATRRSPSALRPLLSPRCGRPRLRSPWRPGHRRPTPVATSVGECTLSNQADNAIGHTAVRAVSGRPDRAAQHHRRRRGRRGGARDGKLNWPGCRRSRRMAGWSGRVRLTTRLIRTAAARRTSRTPAAMNPCRRLVRAAFQAGQCQPAQRGSPKDMARDRQHPDGAAGLYHYQRRDHLRAPAAPAQPLRSEFCSSRTASHLCVGELRQAPPGTPAASC